MGSVESVIDDMKNVQVVLFSEEEIPDSILESLMQKENIAEVTQISNFDEMNTELAKLLEKLRYDVATATLTAINPMTAVDIAGLTVKRLSVAG